MIKAELEIEAEFIEVLELENFPFDVQDLTICLAFEDTVETINITADPTKPIL